MIRFTSRHDILSVVRQLRQSAQTGSNMAAGFQRLYSDVFDVSRGSRPSAAKYVIMLTDGTTSKDPESTQYYVRNQLSIILSIYVYSIAPARLSFWYRVFVCLFLLENSYDCFHQTFRIDRQQLTASRLMAHRSHLLISGKIEPKSTVHTAQPIMRQITTV